MTGIRYPKGFARGDSTKIAVSFPTELFRAIIEIAKQDKKTFNTMVVELCKCGKLDLEESDKLEPPINMDETAERLAALERNTQ